MILKYLTHSNVFEHILDRFYLRDFSICSVKYALVSSDFGRLKQSMKVVILIIAVIC